MSYQLRFDQLLEALDRAEHPQAKECIQMAEGLTNHMAVLIAKQHDILCGTGSFEGGAFAGLCVPFHPKHAGQPLPEVFALYEFDTAGEWGER